MKVKRYTSRKLYDVERQAWTNLDLLREAVEGGEELAVVDAVTGQDRTALVLSLILVAEAEAGRPREVQELLRLVRAGKAGRETKARLHRDVLALLDEDDAQVRGKPRR